jgi:nucleoside phosphorylase
MSTSIFRQIVNSGRQWVLEIEKIGRVGLGGIPPAERLSKNELEGWFSAAGRAIKKAFGSNSNEHKEWQDLRTRQGDRWVQISETTNSYKLKEWYYINELVTMIHEALCLLTTFDIILTREPQKGGLQDIGDNTTPLVTIFVALDMEKEMLVKRWNLKSSYTRGVWTGELKLTKTKISLICPGEMGRVPASIETTKYLHNEIPNLFIVTGIAGGFQSENVALGDVIVATSIIDLAISKIQKTSSNKEFMPEFRPRELPTDGRIKDYLRSGNFDERAWETNVIYDEDWPKGLRPKIIYGALASTDEVVSNDDWIELLKGGWPELLGLEMEAGGVCRVTNKFGFSAAVVKAVTDHANPAKFDNVWRTRAMETVTHLLEIIDYKLIFESQSKS